MYFRKREYVDDEVLGIILQKLGIIVRSGVRGLGCIPMLVTTQVGGTLEALGERAGAASEKSGESDGARRGR